MADKKQKEESSDYKGALKVAKQYWKKTSHLPVVERQHLRSEVLRKLFSTKKIPVAPYAD